MLPYLERTTAKGREYFYYRRDGKRWGRLKGEPGSVEFAASYQKAQDAYEGRAREGAPLAPESFGALVTAYEASPDYTKKLGERTRQEYRRHLSAMVAEWRDWPVAPMEPRHVIEYLDGFADHPSVGNARVKVLCKVLEWGRKRGWVSQNAAARIERLKEGEYQPWPDPVIEQFRRSGPQKEVLWAFEIALGSGQRQGDILSMLWSQYDGTQVEVVQSKTGTKVWIPAHPELKAVLDGIPKRQAVILTTEMGMAWTRRHFGRRFRKAVEDAGIEGYVFHGLRKTAAVRLAEAGCSTGEIKAITGHLSDRMVSHYTKGADRKRLAKAAIERLGKGKK